MTGFSFFIDEKNKTIVYIIYFLRYLVKSYTLFLYKNKLF